MNAASNELNRFWARFGIMESQIQELTRKVADLAAGQAERDPGRFSETLPLKDEPMLKTIESLRADNSALRSDNALLRAKLDAIEQHLGIPPAQLKRPPMHSSSSSNPNNNLETKQPNNSNNANSNNNNSNTNNNSNSKEAPKTAEKRGSVSETKLNIKVTPPSGNAQNLSSATMEADMGFALPVRPKTPTSQDTSKNSGPPPKAYFKIQEDFALPATDASPEEIKTRLTALETSYKYELEALRKYYDEQDQQVRRWLRDKNKSVLKGARFAVALGMDTMSARDRAGTL
jgi:hypothetical protein